MDKNVSVGISVAEAADILGIAQITLREGLKAGVFPFGVAYKPAHQKNYRYLIYPAKFKEYVGVKGEA